ncbi:MAG: hypothetical protein A2010_00855 [Nitrospirae bacterium GWD2_57_9]|nr:MAG: hypothetical protein A2010_00855 [Nitrospirae bacterium GWD2_57_9]OGW46094.1 MAG: hypothetical protein A2078_10590 [Nitrospirae bacterium GWC2_57_9]
MREILQRMKNILLRPRAEWELIKQEQTSLRKLFGGYGALMAAVPPVAALVERFLFNRGIVSNAVHSPFLYVITTNLLWYLVILANILITATIITVIVASKEPGWVSLRGLQLATYSYTPLFLVAMLAVIPRLGWLIYPAILYSLYLLYLGIRSITGAPQGKAAWDAVASFLVTGVVVGILNGLEYMLESFVASKVFF